MSDPALGRFDFTLAMDSLIYYNATDITAILHRLAQRTRGKGHWAGATGDARLILSGGAPLKSDFGTFHAPNISSHPEAGIGAWTLAEFGDAMTRGVGRDGEHLYPSFPYGSYARMTPADIIVVGAGPAGACCAGAARCSAPSSYSLSC